MGTVTAIQLRRVPALELGLTLGDFLIPIRLGERAAIWQRNLLLLVGAMAVGVLAVLALTRTVDRAAI